MKAFHVLKCPLEGSNLIEASAGTGKTHAISGLFLRLILEKNLDVEGILVVTYTVAAAGELRGRIRNLLSETCNYMKGTGNFSRENEIYRELAERFRNDSVSISILQESVRNFDSSSISTIHSFCQNMLLENSFESMQLFGTELVPDQSGLHLEVAEDFWRTYVIDSSELLTQYLAGRRYTPDYFAALLKMKSNIFGLNVVPRLDLFDLKEPEMALAGGFEILGRMWLKERGNLKNIFYNEIESLRGNIYKKNSIDGYFDEMNIYLGNKCILDLPKSFVMFTKSKIISALKKGCPALLHDLFDLCEEFKNSLDRFKSLLDRYFIALEVRLLEYAEDEIIRRNIKMNRRSYRDILLDMNSALSDDPESPLAGAVRKKYRAALIDEFQDTDPVQFSIFTNIFKKKNSILFLIGDPKQAIYGFRGGDIFTYMMAQDDIDNKYTLNINWRSNPDLIKAVNTIFSSAKNPFIFKELEFKKVLPPEEKIDDKLIIDGKNITPFKILFIDRKYLDGGGKKNVSKGSAGYIASVSVAGEISKLLNLGRSGRAAISGKPVEAGDIAVIVRKRAQAAMVREELKFLGIPSVIYGSESVFTADEAAEIRDIIKAIADPGNEMLIKNALITDIMGVSCGELLEIQRDESRWASLCSRFFLYRELWERHDFITMFNNFLLAEKVKERILSYPDGERGITNILHLAELIHWRERDLNTGREGLVKWLSVELLGDSSGENQIRLESDEKAVRLITVHRSKGLDFPIVFCPFMWEGSLINPKRGINRLPAFEFHDTKNGNRHVIDLGSGEESNSIQAEKEGLAENVRLLYVGLTRAKNCCYLYHGKVNYSETSALAYIFHRPETLDDGNLIRSLKAGVEDISHDNMIHGLEKVIEKAGGAIEIDWADDSPGDPIISTGKGPRGNYAHKIFSGKIDRSWAVSSYSSLAAGADKDQEGDEFNETYAKGSDPGESDVENIFTMPGGRIAGQMIHEIFEEIDFSSHGAGVFRKTASDIIIKYGFDLSWIDIILGMVDNVLTVELDPGVPGMKLNEIKKSGRINEMDFYIPCGMIDPAGLREIFRDVNYQRLPSFDDIMSRLNFTRRYGFIRGFIDLVFMFRGKYYIIDWKTNRLGNGIDKYQAESLGKEMISNFYILQYHFYALALHKYLELRVPGYDYEKHFGGVYYLFVRGIDSGLGPDYGIYRDRPGSEIINKFSSYFSERGR